MLDFILEHLGEIAATAFIVLYRKFFPDKKDEISTPSSISDIAKENQLHIKDIKDDVNDIKETVNHIKIKMQ